MFLNFKKPPPLRFGLPFFLPPSFDHLCRRAQDAEGNAAAKVEDVAVDKRLVGNVLRLDGLEVFAVELCRRRLAVVVDGLDLAILEDDGRTTQIIGMGMRDDES